MRIFNGTPHEINFVVNSVSNPEIRKMIVPAGAEPEISASIPSHGMLSAKIETVAAEPVGGIPMFKKAITGIEPIPAEFDVVIVSALYVSAARAAGLPTDKLYTVADPVYSPDGRTILGCRGICPAF